MPTIAVSDIFSPHIGNLYEAIDDKDLIQKNHLVLSELYSFDLILDDLDNPKGYMFSPYSDCIAMIVKLDNTYYLTGIDGCDGYRDDRGKIYQLNFDTTELSTILNKKNIINALTDPLEVNLQMDMRNDYFGIVFLINDYLQTEEGILVTWGTDQADSYYPSGHVYFNPNVLLGATPIIEKQKLEKMLPHQAQNPNKLKI